MAESAGPSGFTRAVDCLRCWQHRALTGGRTFSMGTETQHSIRSAFVRAVLAVLLLAPFLAPLQAAARGDLGVMLGPEPLLEQLTPSVTAGDLTSVFGQARTFWSSALPRAVAVDPDAAQVAASDSGSMAGEVATQAQADAALASAVASWRDGGHDVPALSVVITDLPGLTLGQSVGTTVQVDVDAAGHGWGGGGMDLATVVRHEVGHAAGFGHDAGGVMAATLSAGTSLAALPAAPAAVEIDEPTADFAAAASSDGDAGAEEATARKRPAPRLPNRPRATRTPARPLTTPRLSTTPAPPRPRAMKPRTVPATRTRTPPPPRRRARARPPTWPLTSPLTKPAMRPTTTRSMRPSRFLLLPAPSRWAPRRLPPWLRSRS